MPKLPPTTLPTRAGWSTAWSPPEEKAGSNLPIRKDSPVNRKRPNASLTRRKVSVNTVERMPSGGMNPRMFDQNLGSLSEPSFLTAALTIS